MPKRHFSFVLPLQELKDIENECSNDVLTCLKKRFLRWGTAILIAIIISPAVRKISRKWFCTSSTSTAVQAIRFAARPGACIRYMFPHAAITVSCEATMLRQEIEFSNR
jgi:hypothetical protein